jgi:hypothetical protein
MHGNVWEWVQDCWHDRYNGAPTDGSAWVVACKYDGAYRVIRGGGWGGYVGSCRSAIRYHYGPRIRYYVLGTLITFIYGPINSGKTELINQIVPQLPADCSFLSD